MKIILSFLIIVFSVLASKVIGQRLIVRADDMGITHATNLACIESYKNGIARSVEIIVPSPWFLEAVHLLKIDSSYDVGIHLVITSEWSHLKWRPITNVPSLTDSNGYFFPTIWKGSANFPSLQDQQPDFSEAEKELRAQIEMAMRHLPRISHISTHMGFNGSNPELDKLVQTLSDEYKLPMLDKKIVSFPSNAAMRSDNPAIREAAFIEQLGKLNKEKTYLLVTHPAFNNAEMESVQTPSYSNVAKDRGADLYLLTSKKVIKAIQKSKIQLLSVGEALKKNQ